MARALSLWPRPMALSMISYPERVWQAGLEDFRASNTRSAQKSRSEERKTPERERAERQGRREAGEGKNGGEEN